MRASFRQLGRLRAAAAAPPLAGARRAATAPRSAPRRITSAAWRCSPPATPTGRWSSSATSSASTAATSRRGSPMPGSSAQRGEIREAMGQYLRVADQDPGNVEAQRGGDRDRAADAGLRHRRGACRGGHRPGAPGPADPGAEGDRRLPPPRDPRRRGRERPRAWSPRRPARSPAQMVLIADRLNAGAPKEALRADRRGAGADPRRPGPAPGAARGARGSSATSRRQRRGAEAHGRALPRRSRRAPGAGPVAPARRRPRRCRGGAARRRRRARPPTRSRR